MVPSLRSVLLRFMCIAALLLQPASAQNTAPYTLSANSLSFNFTPGQTAPSPQTVTLTNNLSTTLSVGLSIAYGGSGCAAGSGFLSASISPNPVAAKGRGTITVSVNPSSLQPNNSQPYCATITVSAGGLSSTISVALNVNGVTLTASPASISDSLAPGKSKNYTITLGGSFSNAQITAAGSFLTVSNSALSGPGPFTVTATAGLTPGTLSGSITVQCNACLTAVIPVNITVTAPLSLSVTPNPPAPLTLAVGKTQILPFSVSTSDGSAQQISVATSAPWLTSAGAATAPGSVNVTASAASLSPGTYNGSVSFSCAAISCGTVSVQVALTVSSSAGIFANPASISFQASANGTLPAAQTIQLTSTDGSILAFSIGSVPSWLQVQANQMTTPSTLTVKVIAVPPAPGTATISIIPASSAAALNIPVTYSAAAAPQIKSGGVIFSSNFGAFSTITPGAYVEIYGSNLAATTRGWAGSDFNGPIAPRSLDGVSVLIGGQPAFVNFVSPGQVNVVVPDNIAVGGAITLTLTNANGTTAPYSINAAALAPGLLAPPSFVINGMQYAVALFSDNVTFVLPAGAIPGVASRPAKPGETIVMYGLGFGPVTPATPSGYIEQQANTLQNPLQILFNQTPASLAYQGLASGFVGLYQINVTVPAIPDSNAVPLTFIESGATFRQKLYTAVHQ